ncbi:hypothetical protein, partial [Mesorhizobium sp.]
QRSAVAKESVKLFERSVATSWLPTVAQPAADGVGGPRGAVDVAQRADRDSAVIADLREGLGCNV